MYKEIFIIKLKELRKENGITQEEIAVNTEIPRVKINRFENGERIPNIEELGKIADYFEKTTDYFLGRNKE